MDFKTKVVLAGVAGSAALAVTHTSEAAEHVVQPGESLWLIADKYGTTIDNIKKLNNLSSNLIFPYQSLKVSYGEASAKKPVKKVVVQKPVQKAPQKIVTLPGVSTYKVKPGDSLSLIAGRYGVTVNDLMAWNNLKGYLIFPDQVLKVKAGSIIQSPKAVTPATLAVKPKVKAPAANQYIIKPGDSLGLISYRTGVSISNLKLWNNLSSDLIHPNQVLKLSGTQVSASSSVSMRMQSVPAAPSYTPPTFSHSNLYDNGQCTWYVFNKRAAAGKPISTYWWHAYNWASAAKKDGYRVDNIPSAGSIGQTTDGTYGHVVYVERVNPDGSVLVSETNYLTPPGVPGYRTLTGYQLSRYVFIH